ncbi:MAG TPA: helix-turn-helix domain-containing protein [Dysgonomonas sp.]|uniref:helix-turn-helix domain-containing protein n=1 Tax=unclassified Dysgonomonas TaxID=2630389 RepID=UPI0025BE6700|nr:MULTISPECIES: helix-turn-helix domain-containing protein [unclassified Dysgonomonas]HML65968.1 helix-turn-helix domain-containing protein [Dysgonomonas sp.]
MRSEIITKDNEKVKRFFQSLDRMLDKVESVITKHRPTLKGERFLTDAEVSERLKVSRRTLQEYRSTGKIPYIQLGGKTLYQESDIQKLLDTNYNKAFE